VAEGVVHGLQAAVGAGVQVGHDDGGAPPVQAAAGHHVGQVIKEVTVVVQARNAVPRGQFVGARIEAGVFHCHAPLRDENAEDGPLLRVHALAGAARQEHDAVDGIPRGQVAVLRAVHAERSGPAVAAGLLGAGRLRPIGSARGQARLGRQHLEQRGLRGGLQRLRQQGHQRLEQGRPLGRREWSAAHGQGQRLAALRPGQQRRRHVAADGVVHGLHQHLDDLAPLEGAGQRLADLPDGLQFLAAAALDLPAGLLQIAQQGGVADLHAAAFERPLYHHARVRKIQRLLDIVVRPEPQRLRGRALIRIPPQQDHFTVGLPGASAGHHLHGGAPGHDQVEHEQRVRLSLQRRDGLLAVRDGVRRVPLAGTKDRDDVAHPGVIVSDQDPLARHLKASRSRARPRPRPPRRPPPRPGTCRVPPRPGCRAAAGTAPAGYRSPGRRNR